MAWRDTGGVRRIGSAPESRAGQRATTGAGAAAAVVAAVLALAPVLGVAPAGGSASRPRARFAVPASARQLVLVSAPGEHPPGDVARVQTFARPGPSSPWHAVSRAFRGEIGAAGLHDVRHEGDRSTPTGVYRIGPTLFGNAPDPGGLHAPFRRLACGDWWDEDPVSVRYNELVHVRCGRTPPFAADSEALWTETVAYRYLAVLEFNVHPRIRGRGAPGSGIFLHAWVGAPTEGCVALRVPALLDVLRWLRPAAHPVVAIGTDAELDAVATSGGRGGRGRGRGREAMLQAGRPGDRPLDRRGDAVGVADHRHLVAGPGDGGVEQLPRQDP